MEQNLAFLDGKKGFRSRYTSTPTADGHPKTPSEFVSSIKKCSKTRDLEGGKKLHRDAVAAGFHTDKYIASVLITMYSRCQSIHLARKIFDGMIHKDIVSWNSLILGYVDNGESSKAMQLFTDMDLEPDSFTYVAALKACAGLSGGLEIGTSIHTRARERACDSNAFVANTLIDMYCKCGSVHQAREVFSGMTHKDVVTWTCILLGYVENGEHSVAMELFESMDCQPDSYTYAAVLKACGGLASERETDKQECLHRGVFLHQQVKDQRLDTDTVVTTALLHMYIKCGCMQTAQEVFYNMHRKDVVTWNCIILGYVENGESSLAMSLFQSMDCEPDCFTYVAVLKACAGLAESDKEYSLTKGRAIHTQLKARGYDSDIVVLNTLLDIYVRCGSMNHARDVFTGMTRKDVVTWTCLINGYLENGESSAALELFTSMDCEPDCFAYASALKACGGLTTLADGEWIHARVCKLGLEQDKVIATALVDFYGKCGCMDMSDLLFNGMQSPNIASWTSLIGGYSSLGDLSQVFSLAKKINEAGLQVDSIMYICILTACSHAGLLEEGIKYFESMLRHGITPSVDHYNCMVDMLGRANRLEEAFEIVNNMPSIADSVTWTTLLAACKKWKNMEVGKAAFDVLVSAEDKENPAAYVLMRDISRSF